MEIRPRVESALDDMTLLMVQMGAGNAKQTTRTVVDNHDLWKQATGSGLFTLSVYALRRPREEILGVMPHSQFGLASVGSLRSAGLAILPTDTLGVSEELMRLQSDHYSIVVAEGIDGAVLELNETDKAALTERLVKPVAEVLGIFQPRFPNPYKRAFD
jgi:hypothetical protein